MGRKWYRNRAGLIATGLLVAVGVYLAVRDDSQIEIERDRQPAFQIDPNQPYEISVREVFLPSGGWQDTTISQDGRAVVKRETYVSGAPNGYFKLETATFTTSEETRAQVLEAIESARMMKLHRRYSLANTFDGYLWGCAIKQGDREKRVSCANYFPEEVTRFKNRFAAILSRYQKDLKWREIEQLRG
jgi:hypothetical protein